MQIRVSDLIKLLDGTLLQGDSNLLIEGFASLKEAMPGDLSFFYDPRYLERLASCKAGAILVPRDMENLPAQPTTCIGVSDPSRAFEQVTETFGVQPRPFQPGVHSSAAIAESARLDPARVCVAANAVIDDGAQLDDGVEIGAGCYVGRNVCIGKDSKLYANVSVHEACTLGMRVILHSSVVIGGDGFGYELDEGRHRKIRQSGIVQIDDDVEVGAGTTIDRARFGRTWIGEGTKIDNLVQIGHNCVIGKHCILVAMVAIAGSAVIGDYVVVAAQTGIGGHVSVGSRSTLGGRCGVTKDLAPGQVYLGYPAIPMAEEKRRLASIRRLPRLTARIKELERRLAALEK